MIGDAEEQEANIFAMELLMPLDFLREDLKNSIDIESDKNIKRLAQKYKVSEQLMTMRLGMLTNEGKLP